MSEEKDLVITLDNNKNYVKISSTLLEGKKFIYLANIEDYKDVIIGEIVDDEITVVEDTELFGRLLVEFNKIIQEEKKDN